MGSVCVLAPWPPSWPRGRRVCPCFLLSCCLDVAWCGVALCRVVPELCGMGQCPTSVFGCGGGEVVPSLPRGWVCGLSGVGPAARHPTGCRNRRAQTHPIAGGAGLGGFRALQGSHGSLTPPPAELTEPQTSLLPMQTPIRGGPPPIQVLPTPRSAHIPKPSATKSRAGAATAPGPDVSML